MVEFRRYTLHPAKRDTLIDLFEHEFIETQEDVGMSVLGQFIDLDDPDSFVWLRGFADMDSRREGLTAFYGGPIWKAHRNAANATMVDSDNVLLLRPARATARFSVGSRAADTDAVGDQGIVVAGVYYVVAGQGSAAQREFELQADRLLSTTRGSLLGYFVTEASASDYTALPVRDENAFVWFLGFSELQSFEQASSQVTECHHQFASALAASAPPELLYLAPTRRSLLTGASAGCAAADDLRFAQRLRSGKAAP